MTRMTGAQALVRQLQSEGVDTIFGLPGVQIMAAFDALHEVRDGMNLVHVRHEQATTYMADGYARATGKVGVGMAVPGPGALNATAGLGTAFACSSPVLLISGQIDSGSLGRRQGQLHEVDEQLDVFKPITKWNHRVTRVEEIPEVVHEAFRQMRTGRPRPVELEIPPDTLGKKGTAHIIEPEEYHPKAASPGDIAEAAQMLLEARRPAIIAGGGSLISDAGDELAQVAEMIQAPIMTTQGSKGVISEVNPFHTGTNYIEVGPASEIIPDCDVLLAVGTRLLLKELERKTPRIIHVDVDPGEIGKNFSTEVRVIADAKVAMGQLAKQLKVMRCSKPSRLEEIAQYKRRTEASVLKLAPNQVGIIQSMRDQLDDDAVVVAGVTNIGYWSNVAYEVRQPRSYVTSGYFGTLGYAFPTALGVKTAVPDKQVVALCGDGGFMYSPQELSTAVQYGINIVAVVFNNNAFGASRWDQTHRYDGRFIGTGLANPDFMKLADSFGVLGIRTHSDGFGDALGEALKAEAPVLLEVDVPVEMPPFQII